MRRADHEDPCRQTEAQADSYQSEQQHQYGGGCDQPAASALAMKDQGRGEQRDGYRNEVIQDEILRDDIPEVVKAHGKPGVQYVAHLAFPVRTAGGYHSDEEQLQRKAHPRRRRSSRPARVPGTPG